MDMDHVAVPSNDVPASVKWYVEHCGAKVLYADDTWAFMQMGAIKLAIVTPRQHPPHIALRVDEPALNQAAADAGVEIDHHRDGTRGIYIHDPFGNAVELICYPPGKTIYEQKA